MIGAIYSMLNKVWTLLSSFSRVRNAIYWGTGDNGNVYIGPAADAPNGYTVLEPSIETNKFVFPEASLLRYQNLIINCECTFTYSPIVIQATESITIKDGGHLHVDNLGSNAREAHFLYTNNGIDQRAQGNTNVFVLSNGMGDSTSPGGTLVTRTYFANNLPTNYRVYLTGAEPNKLGLSNGGSLGASGGLVLIYTGLGGLTYKPVNDTAPAPTEHNITANGSQAGGQGGGMLSILTPKLIIEGSGKISSDGGGTGIGTQSYLNIVPFTNTSHNNEYGGGGLAMWFELPVKDI